MTNPRIENFTTKELRRYRRVFEKKQRGRHDRFTPVARRVFFSLRGMVPDRPMQRYHLGLDGTVYHGETAIIRGKSQVEFIPLRFQAAVWNPNPVFWIIVHSLNIGNQRLLSHSVPIELLNQEPIEIDASPLAIHHEIKIQMECVLRRQFL